MASNKEKFLTKKQQADLANKQAAIRDAANKQRGKLRDSVSLKSVC